MRAEARAEAGERLRESYRKFANRERDLADEITAQRDCDDPQHPHVFPQRFRDYSDFIEKVARPLVEADGDEATVQAAMKLYRTVSPYYICVSMVMLQNRITE